MSRVSQEATNQTNTVLKDSSSHIGEDYASLVSTCFAHGRLRCEDQLFAIVDDSFMRAIEGLGVDTELIQLILPFTHGLEPMVSVTIDRDERVLKSRVNVGEMYYDNYETIKGAFAELYGSLTPQEREYLNVKPEFNDYTKADELCDFDVRHMLRQAFSKKQIRQLLSILSGLILLIHDQDDLEACSLIEIDPHVLQDAGMTRQQVIYAIYDKLLRFIVGSINAKLSQGTTNSSSASIHSGDTLNDADDSIAAVVHFLSITKSSSLVRQQMFDVNQGINAEMVGDGLKLKSSPELFGELSLHRPVDISDITSFTQSHLLTKEARKAYSLPDLFASSRLWTVFTRDHPPIDSWNAFKQGNNFTTDFDHEEFVDRYYDAYPSLQSILPLDVCEHPLSYYIGLWARNNVGSASEIYVGRDRVWISENTYRKLEAKYAEFSQTTPVQEQGEWAAQGGDEKAMLESHSHELHYDDKEIVDESLLKDVDPELGENVHVEEQTRQRRVWMTIVWAMTWWVPSGFLHHLGRLKRKEERIAWREKFAIFVLIFFLNCVVIFYMIFLGRILCPDFDKAWTAKEVGYHQGEDDFFVSIQGKVYDITKFYRQQHSDTSITTSAANMIPFAGQDMTSYFPNPLTSACQGLVDDPTVWLASNNTIYDPTAIHYSGDYKTSDTGSALYNLTWYNDVFQPSIAQYYKGPLVAKSKELKENGEKGWNKWVVIDGSIYDLTNYFYTLDQVEGYPNKDAYDFLHKDVKAMVDDNAGQDVTDIWKRMDLKPSERVQNMECLKNAFYAGKPDFRQSARCQVSNYILLVVAILLCSVVLIKFLAAMQLGSLATPDTQNKYVVCHVPAYTEDEEALRRAIDSIAALEYPDSRKLLLVVCDGMIVGQGNDQTTPQIVLDIVGHDPRAASEVIPYAFESIGDGAARLNYGKVYSGLYHYDGRNIPYCIVVKVGKESETSKPGNRGKRDSQVLLMRFFNRVASNGAMNPLELEMFHHIGNVIGVDPGAYEYMFMVDADTRVKEDSLNFLVADCVSDVNVVGICGETALQNENQSIWTMVQVYEYFISHHLSKAFESLFGSVTCLPGCFSMYRLKNLIDNRVLEEYSTNKVNTLHMKNLLSLGEDRFLTTLMTKRWPKMRFTFCRGAMAYTTAPDSFSVLVSQRRRWINSTVHNLVELLRINSMCGFCFFGMRFIVFIDLAGTLMLPSVCVYLAYLIYVIAAHAGAFPLVSVIMFAAVYGLQAIIYIIKQEWQHIFWMIIYICAYPFHSFLLPIYSFWKMNDFSWGNTRIVVEKDGKQLVQSDIPRLSDKEFNTLCPLDTWESHALRNNLPIFAPDDTATVYNEDYLDQPAYTPRASTFYTNTMTNTMRSNRMSLLEQQEQLIEHRRNRFSQLGDRHNSMQSGFTGF
ncbi:YALIA101S05e10682g1_1 [Yarrowia lipolytica]|nr:YALIA101S05e10682g1_1 [Yarrowia lipolytica]